MNVIDIAKQYFAASNASDFERIEDLLAPDIEYTSESTGSFVGRDAVLAMQRTFHEGFATKEWQIRDIAELDDAAVQITYDFSGQTQKGEHKQSSGIETIYVDSSGLISRIAIRSIPQV